MFINSELSMEDFISCDPTFTQGISEFFELKDVEIVGRQVNVGVKNRIDILYKGTSMLPCGGIVLVVVELKYRPLEAKDFAQIGRYKSALEMFFDGTRCIRAVHSGRMQFRRQGKRSASFRLQSQARNKPQPLVFTNRSARGCTCSQSKGR